MGGGALSPGMMHIWNRPQNMPVHRPLLHVTHTLCSGMRAYALKLRWGGGGGGHLFSTTVFCVMYLTTPAVTCHNSNH